MASSGVGSQARVERYDGVAIALHWLLAGLILANLLLALNFEQLHGAARGAPIRLHKSIGVTILVLGLARGLWRLARRPPPLPPELSPLTRRTAKAAHAGLYVLMVVTPLSGWAMISADAGGRSTVIWGAAPWPRIRALVDLPPATREVLHTALNGVHLALGLTLAALIAVHVAGAFRHQLRGVRELERILPAWLARDARRP